MAISIILAAIAFYDAKYHRIPNKAIGLLLVVSILHFHRSFDLRYFVLSTAGTTFFTAMSRCGLGDTKLLLVILNAVIPSDEVGRYLYCLLALTIAHLIFQITLIRSLRGNIAFAPALCGAVLLLNLSGDI